MKKRGVERTRGDETLKGGGKKWPTIGIDESGRVMMQVPEISEAI